MSTLSATNRSRQKVLGYPVDVVDQGLALEVIESAWRSGKGLQIVTLNAEMVVAAQQDAELDRIIRHAHLIIPDGAGVVWAVRLAGQQIERLPGIELAAAALQRAAVSGRRVTLIGGRNEIVSRLAQDLADRYPGLNVVNYHHGFFAPDEAEEIVDELAQEEPELVLVALGVPKQEYFIDRFASAFPKAVLIGVGGSFDVWAGEIKRAPAVMQRLNLEWHYRLFKEPWRWRRMGSSIPNFGFQVFQDFLKGRRDVKKRKNHSSEK